MCTNYWFRWCFTKIGQHTDFNDAILSIVHQSSFIKVIEGKPFLHHVLCIRGFLKNTLLLNYDLSTLIYYTSTGFTDWHLGRSSSSWATSTRIVTQWKIVSFKNKNYFWKSHETLNNMTDKPISETIIIFLFLEIKMA